MAIPRTIRTKIGSVEERLARRVGSLEKDGNESASEGHRECDYLEWIARVTAHIPERGIKRCRCNVPSWGRNVMRGKGTISIKGVVILLTALVLQGTNWAAAEELTVMTRNLYLGADLTPAISAQNKEQFLPAMFDIMGTIESNNFPERAAAFAAEIWGRQPHSGGLQEGLNFTIH